MKKRNMIFALVLAVFMTAAVAFAFENKQTEQKAVVAGTVSQTISAGSVVKSGDSLVDISTLTGTASACRATVGGTVTQVLVKAGDSITPGQIVVYIEPAE